MSHPRPSRNSNPSCDADAHDAAVVQCGEPETTIAAGSSHSYGASSEALYNPQHPQPGPHHAPVPVGGRKRRVGVLFVVLCAAAYFIATPPVAPKTRRLIRHASPSTTDDRLIDLYAPTATDRRRPLARLRHDTQVPLESNIDSAFVVLAHSPDTKHRDANLLFFLRHALAVNSPRVHHVIVVSNSGARDGDFSALLAVAAATTNVEVRFRDGGGDRCAWRAALHDSTPGAVLGAASLSPPLRRSASEFTHVLLVSTHLRGPFVGALESPSAWIDSFINVLGGSTDVRLAGPTIACSGAAAAPYVPAGVWAFRSDDAVTVAQFGLPCDEGGGSLALTKLLPPAPASADADAALARAFLSAGHNIGALSVLWRGADLRGDVGSTDAAGAAVAAAAMAATTAAAAAAPTSIQREQGSRRCSSAYSQLNALGSGSSSSSKKKRQQRDSSYPSPPYTDPLEVLFVRSAGASSFLAARVSALTQWQTQYRPWALPRAVYGGVTRKRGASSGGGGGGAVGGGTRSGSSYTSAQGATNRRNYARAPSTVGSRSSGSINEKDDALPVVYTVTRYSDSVVGDRTIVLLAEGAAVATAVGPAAAGAGVAPLVGPATAAGAAAALPVMSDAASASSEASSALPSTSIASHVRQRQRDGSTSTSSRTASLFDVLPAAGSTSTSSQTLSLSELLTAAGLTAPASARGADGTATAEDLALLTSNSEEEGGGVAADADADVSNGVIEQKQQQILQQKQQQLQQHDPGTGNFNARTSVAGTTAAGAVETELTHETPATIEAAPEPPPGISAEEVPSPELHMQPKAPSPELHMQPDAEEDEESEQLVSGASASAAADDPETTRAVRDLALEQAEAVATAADDVEDTAAAITTV